MKTNPTSKTFITKTLKEIYPENTVVEKEISVRAWSKLRNPISFKVVKTVTDNGHSLVLILNIDDGKYILLDTTSQKFIGMEYGEAITIIKKYRIVKEMSGESNIFKENAHNQLF